MRKEDADLRYIAPGGGNFAAKVGIGLPQATTRSQQSKSYDGNAPLFLAVHVAM